MGASPAKAFLSSNASSFKSSSPTKPVAEIKRESEHDETEVIDTRSLLEKMKGTVEEMKRRRSLAPAATPVRRNLETPITFARASGQRLSFGSPTNGNARVSEGDEGESDEEKVNGVNQAQKVEVDGVSMHEDRFKEEMRKLERLEAPLFSLLRPGVLEESRAQKDEVGEVAQDDSTPVVVTESAFATPGAALAEIDEEMQVDEDDPQVNNS